MQTVAKEAERYVYLCLYMLSSCFDCLSDLRRRCGIAYCLTLLRIAIAFYNGMYYAVLVPIYPTLNVNGTTVKFYDLLLRFCI